MLNDFTSARHLPSISPFITVNLCHTQRQVTVAVQDLWPSFPAAAGRMIHLFFKPGIQRGTTTGTKKKTSRHTEAAGKTLLFVCYVLRTFYLLYVHAYVRFAVVRDHDAEAGRSAGGEGDSICCLLQFVF